MLHLLNSCLNKINKQGFFFFQIIYKQKYITKKKTVEHIINVYIQFSIINYFPAAMYSTIDLFIN